MNFFSLEVEGFDVLNSTELLRRRNVIVNRLLMITNILITIFIAVYYKASPSINFASSLSLLIPPYIINIVITYFVNNQKEDNEKQILGMYVAVLAICYIPLRLFILYPEPFTYIFIYISLVIISLFQNRHAIILGDVLIFSVAVFIHLNDEYNAVLVTGAKNSFHDTAVYLIFLLLFMFVITSIVFFGEYLDKERKNELKKREELETEFKDVLFHVFDTIADFSQVSENDELSTAYVSALMAKKLGLMLKYDERKCDELFNFAVVIGVNNDFSLNYDETEKAELLKDYSKIRYKLDIGSMLLRRTRLRIKCEAMVRSRYESWLLSENFKNIKSEDDQALDNQIILLCETYIILRSKQSYKKALPHSKTIKDMTENFMHFFDEQLFNVFLENAVEFEIIYERTIGSKNN